MKITKLESNRDVAWYQLDGLEPITEFEFENETWGITSDNQILDCDGCPRTEGDRQTIAVRNALEKIAG